MNKRLLAWIFNQTTVYGSCVTPPAVAIGTVLEIFEWSVCAGVAAAAIFFFCKNGFLIRINTGVYFG